jgi:hypothetical protein
LENGAASAIRHREIVAIEDYIARHGNRQWGEMTLYTTGEPSPDVHERTRTVDPWPGAALETDALCLYRRRLYPASREIIGGFCS